MQRESPSPGSDEKQEDKAKRKRYMKRGNALSEEQVTETLQKGIREAMLSKAKGISNHPHSNKSIETGSGELDTTAT